MTNTITKTPLLQLTQNLIAVESFADQRLLKAVREAADTQFARAEQANKVIAEQAAEIASLKAKIEFDQQANQRIVYLLKGEIEAKTSWEAALENLTPQERALLRIEEEEKACYDHSESFTCRLTFESFRAHLKADWESRKGIIRYRCFLQFLLDQLKLAKIPGLTAQAANECLIEWFPNTCSNLKTYEEKIRKAIEEACYLNVGSFTCCLTLESFRAHLKADWENRKESISYRGFLQFLLDQLQQAKIPGPTAQAANECLIEWFPNTCSNLKTYEEKRKGI